MRTIERTGQFKRDFKRESKGQHRLTLLSDLTDVVAALANDQALDPRHRDHGLTGDWKDHRDCHIKPDLVLIYRLPDGERLQLVAERNVKKRCWLPRARACQSVLLRPRQFEKILPYQPAAENRIDSVSRRNVTSCGDTARYQVCRSA